MTRTFFPAAIRRVLLLSLVLGLGFGLAACSHVPAGSGVDDARVDHNRLVLDTLALAQKTATASAEEQRRELAAAQQAFTRERSLANRLRLGTLLALPLPNLEDEARAVQVLEPVVAQAGPGSPAGQLAALLLGQVNDRLKQTRRAQQLKEQLDELKSIERQLIERGRRSAPSARP